MAMYMRTGKGFSLNILDNKRPRGLEDVLDPSPGEINIGLWILAI